MDLPCPLRETEHSRGRPPAAVERDRPVARAAAALSSFASVARAAGGLLLLGPLAASASHFEVHFDDRSADRMITAFEREGVSVELLEEVTRSDGYRLLYDQIAAGSKPFRPVQTVEEEFRAALEAGLDGQPWPGHGLHRIRARPDRYREALREFRRIRSTLQWKISARLSEMLPPVSDFTSTAHLIVGGDMAGFAFSDRSDVVIRLDDFVRATDESPLDVDRLATVLGHELFHVGFRSAGGLPPRPPSREESWLRLATAHGPDLVGEVWRAGDPSGWNAWAMASRLSAWVPPPAWNPRSVDRVVAVMSRLQNEGSAVYVSAPLRRQLGSRGTDAELATWLRDLGEDLRRFGEMVERMAHGADPEEIDRLAADGFRSDGPFYRVGYRMAERIDTLAGRRPFLDTIRQGPLEFFETYFETHPYGPEQIDPVTEQEIRRLIREIRAVGAFDPEG